MPSTRVRNPRGAGSRLRDDLVVAAEQLLQEGGERALTMRAASRAVGAAPQSVYAHFADREQLLWAVLRRWFAELEGVLEEVRMAPERDSLHRLRRLALAYCEYGLAHPSRYRLLLVRDRPVAHDLPLDDFPGARVFRILQLALGDVLADIDPGRESEQAAFLAATDLLATLHGAVLLRIGQPSFPWPPMDGVVDRAINTNHARLLGNAGQDGQEMPGQAPPP